MIDYCLWFQPHIIFFKDKLALEFISYTNVNASMDVQFYTYAINLSFTYILITLLPENYRSLSNAIVIVYNCYFTLNTRNQ